MHEAEDVYGLRRDEGRAERSQVEEGDVYDAGDMHGRRQDAGQGERAYVGRRVNVRAKAV